MARDRHVVLSKREVRIPIGTHEVTFSATEPVLVDTGDAEVALGLIYAMANREPIRSHRPVTPQLARNIPAIQGILNDFFGIPVVPVDLRTTPVQATAGPGVGSFFSGGVDSYFTARRHADIDHLIFVHGFDIDLGSHELRERASEAANRAAASMGKQLIEVTTNMRSVRFINENWGWYHGAAMASVAHLLSSVVGRVHVPATYTYADLFAWGSHPMLDPLWSGDGLRFEHDGAEVTRFDKIGALAGDTVAAEHLRVCWENPGGAYNCGRCEKCTRTMIALRAHGALDRFRVFDGELDLRKVRFGELNHETQVAFTRQGLRRLEETQADPKLAAALRWRLRVGPLRHRAISIARRMKAVSRGLRPRSSS